MVGWTPTEKGGLVPHLVCSSCNAGLYSAARPADLIDASCPSCGVSPGHVRRAVPRTRRPSSARTSSAEHQRIADHFGAFMARASSADN